MGTMMVVAMLAALGCGGDPPEGLQPTPSGDGPRVVWDIENTPIPEIPFPNDFALRLDSGAATGRRVNISTEASTEVERRFRRRAARLDGFGTYSPITVGFDAPLDTAQLLARQSNGDPSDDAVVLLDITPESPTFGQAVPLDFGSGALPQTVLNPNHYFAHDPHAGRSSLIFETLDEDTNRNGTLDAGEDVDGDGVLDRPNLTSSVGNEWDDLMTFFERETNTLVVRPLLPLREGTRYAVVLTSHLKGLAGQPVRSPFPFVTLAAQTDALRVLPSLLEPLGLSSGDVAFAWTFTTATVTAELRAVRAGLYGHGTLRWLAAQFDPTLTLDPVRAEDSSQPIYMISGDDLVPVADLLGASFGLSPAVSAAMKESYQYISHIVVGRYVSPNFLVDRDGHATANNPADDDETFEIDVPAGEAVVGDGVVSFLCVIPKPTDTYKQPFPVTMKTNGTAVPKIGALAYAGIHARQGLATCSIDAFGHGFALPPDLKAVLQPVVEGLGLAKILTALEGTRLRDLDNDGVGDSGGDFWSPDPFHSRDTVRQTVVDWLQFVRILRGFDGTRTGSQDLNGDGTIELLGDFDGDGVPDIGGESTTYSAWGVSLGGIVTAVFAGIEPRLEAAVPQSGGGGMVDIAMRSLQSGVPEMVLMGTWGPFVMGRQAPGDEGGAELLWMAPHFDKVELLRFATLPVLEPGDTVALTNLTTGEFSHALVNPQGGFRLSVPADALRGTAIRTLYALDPSDPDFTPHVLSNTLPLGDAMRVCIYDGDGKERRCVDTFEEDVTWQGLIYPAEKPLVALTEGLGRDRSSPDHRRLAGIAQAVLDPADPINWAPHYSLDPLDFAYDAGVKPGCNVLNLLTIGDANVPVSTGVSISRAAGFVTDEHVARLVEHGVIEGNWRLARYRTDGTGPHAFDATFDWSEQKAESILYDPDNLDEDTDGFGAPRPDTPMRPTVATRDGGVSGQRILYVDPRGSHGLLPSDPTKAFPVETYGINLITRYMITGGTDLPDDLCLATASCDFYER